MEIIEAILADPRRWNGALLALVSFALYVIGSILGDRLATHPEGAVARQLAPLRRQPVARALFELVRLVFYLGLPFLALYMGWIDLRSIGLGVLDWAQGGRWAIIILLAGWLMLMVVWLPYLRATANVLPIETSPGYARRLVELVYMQAHWLFYRAALIVLLTGIVTESLYWGAALGLGFVAFEAFLNPRVRRMATQLGAADGVVWSFAMAIISTFAFIVTRNLWIVVGIHFLLEFTVPHLRARQPVKRSVPAPPVFKRSAQEKQKAVGE